LGRFVEHLSTVGIILMNTDKDTISIPLSKTRIILLTFGSIVFVTLGIWMWFNADMNALYDPTLVRLMAVNAFIFFGISGLIGFRKVFDTNPGLVIDKLGITDNSSAVGGQTIKWEDITALRIEEVKRTKFILVFVKNPQDYIDKAKPFKKFWMKLNLRAYETPLSITATTLQCSISDLAGILNLHLKNNCA
jgi:hypothetical protein